MNTERMKFAWARGARIQLRTHEHSGIAGLWSTCISRGIYMLDPPLYDYRIHPNDEHLQYGPLSTALREIVYFPPEKYTAMHRVALQTLVIYESDMGFYHDTSTEFAMAALMLAEYFADEGL